MNKQRLIALLLPMMFIAMTSFAYASWTTTVTKTYTLTAGSCNLAIVDYTVTAYKGFGYTIEQPNEDTLIITDPIVIPHWYMVLNIIIENIGTCPVTITVDETYNNALFFVHLLYSDGFWKDFNSDGVYETSVEEGFTLAAGEKVQKVESLGPWTGQEHPELEGFEFELVITITGTQADP